MWRAGGGRVQMGKGCVECWAAKGMGHSRHLSFSSVPLCVTFVECRDSGATREGKGAGREDVNGVSSRAVALDFAQTNL